MTDNNETPKKPKQSRSPEEAARWRAMKPYIVPTQLLKHVQALDAVVDNLDPLINPKAKRKKSFVARYAERLTPEDTKTAFEDILDKAEKVLRHARKEKGYKKENYDITVLRTLIEKGSDTAREAVDNTHGYSAHSQRLFSFKATAIEPMREVLRRTANEYAKKVNSDKLWNAYRMDFRGKSREALEEVPFMRELPHTAEILREIARTRKMQEILRVLDEGSEAQIVKAAAHLREAVPEGDMFRTGQLGAHLDALAHADPYAVSEDDLDYHVGDDEALATTPPPRASRNADAAQQFHAAWSDVRGALQEAVTQRILAYGKLGANDAHARSLARRFNEQLLDAYKNDAKAFMKKHPGDDEALTIVLRSAPHIEPLISYLRAEAALRTMDKVIEKQWYSIASMYCAPPAQGWSRGGPPRTAS